MKRFMILSICALLLCVLSACGGGNAEGGETLSQQKEVETPKLLSQVELEELFQKVFDSKGDIQSQEDAQITAELSAVKEAADTDTLPANYEALYRSWREGLVSAWEAKVEQLKEGYKKTILADTDLTSAWDAGQNCYADYVDFDGDGMPELLTIVKLNDDTIAMKLYGNKEGQVSLLCEGPVLSQYGDSFYLDWDNWIRLYQDNENSTIYLGTHGYAGGTKMWNYNYQFYTLTGGEWQLIEELNDGVAGWDEGVESYAYWRSFGEDISEQEYAAKLSQYTDCQEILSLEPGTQFPKGVLSDVLTIKLTVNGQPVELGTQPFVEKGVFMAPVRPVLEAMGVAVYAMSKDTYADTWETEYSRNYIKDMTLQGPPMVIASTKKQTWSIRTTKMLDDNFVYYHPGDYYADYGNENDTSPAPHMTGGNMVAPISKMVEFFGGKVDWNSTGRTLAVTGSIPEADRMSEEEIKSMATFSSKAASSIMESNGYRFYSWGWSPGNPDLYRNGKKYWTFVVLPQGAELEYSWDDGRTNATYVTVGSDGSVSWGDMYYESMV